MRENLNLEMDVAVMGLAQEGGREGGRPQYVFGNDMLNVENMALNGDDRSITCDTNPRRWDNNH